ncbi:MAG: NAD(P)-binding domain-containing protein [Acidobacteria bacterium]|nr:NAD(P)-binding domain-containing protein [Acidobacteriota bacterium]
MSACLTAAGIDHVVVERGDIGERWRSERWTSLRLLTPNWMTRLPGPALRITDRDGFMTSGEFVRHLATYARTVGAPLLTRVAVTSLSAEGEGYRLATTSGSFRARAVVIATGACDRPARPAWSAGLSPALFQITPELYRGADSVADGGVLVVGASATGAQIARELRRAGHPVTLAAGRHVRAPRRYRGQDIFTWLDRSGFLSDPLADGADIRRLRAQPSLQLMGSATDGEVGLPDLAREGVRIVGRALAGTGTRIRLGRDLPDESAASEARRRRLLSRIDAHIADAGIDVPPEPEAWRPVWPPDPGPCELDLRAEGIGTVVWATGYRRAYPWLNVPVLDAEGEIRADRGVAAAPGLFVLGLPFQRHRASVFIDGVGRDAEALLPHIARHLGAPVPIAA